MLYLERVFLRFRTAIFKTKTLKFLTFSKMKVYSSCRCTHHLHHEPRAVTGAPRGVVGGQPGRRALRTPAPRCGSGGATAALVGPPRRWAVPPVACNDKETMVRFGRIKWV